MSGADDTYAYAVAAANTVYYESPEAQSDYNTWQAAITAAGTARTSSDAGFNVTRVTALGVAQVNDATALATANTNLVAGQQSVNVTLAQLIQQASDAQADADAGVSDTAIQTIAGAGQTQADSFASDGSSWATTTEDADDGADETISNAVSTLTVAIGQAAANYNLAQFSAAATAAATTESATPSSANLFASQYASAAYQWTQLVAPQFVAMVQSSANADQQDEISDDGADETLAGQLATDESTYETTTAASDASDATTDGDAAVEDARETAHNDDAYPVATAVADAALANTTAGAQGTAGIAQANADATEQLAMATAGVTSPTTAMAAAFTTAVANAQLGLVTTQATADVTWTLAYSQAGVADAEGDVAADAKAGGTTAAADLQDMTADADAAQGADNADAGHELTDEQTMISDASSDAARQTAAQETLWTQTAADTVSVLGTLNTTVGSPLTQYLVARAGTEQSVVSTLIGQFNTYSQAVLTAETNAANSDIQAALTDTQNDDAAVDTAIHSIAGDLLTDADADISDVVDYAQSMAGPINGYSAAVANAQSQDALTVAQAAHDLAIGLITQSGYQSALATASGSQASGLNSAALQYALQEIIPDAKDTLAMAGSDLGSTKAIDLVLANLQTTLDANDKAFDLTLDGNDQTSGLAIASATLTFVQNSSSSYDAALDNLASTSPSVYSTDGAALADALNIQTQANAVASYNQSVSQVNAAWTLATTTDTATAAANDALAAAGLVAGNSAAQAIYNQIMGQVAANQAALAAGSIQATLPTVVTPPAIVTLATAFTEVASLAGPAQDTFSNIGLNAPLGNSGYILNLDTNSPAWYGGTSQLGEGLSLGTTINLVEHPPAFAAPTTDNAALGRAVDRQFAQPERHPLHRRVRARRTDKRSRLVSPDGRDVLSGGHPGPHV